MTDKAAFITGASSGIGYAAALAFARQGIHVGATARREDKLNELVRAGQGLPGQILPIAADVCSADDMQRAVAQTVARFGRVDYCIANAGIGQRGSIVDSEWEHLETLLRTNIDGVMHTIRAAVPEMRKTGGGHIVIVSSVVANMIAPYAATYSASKAFVSSLARSLRLELEADNITVTDILVGRTSTEFNKRRLGAAGYAERAARLPTMTPEKVADAIVRACERRKPHTLTLRPFDRLIVWANTLIPGFIGRRAMRQYKT
jgi:short-subunit dehydrogenase